MAKGPLKSLALNLMVAFLPLLTMVVLGYITNEETTVTRIGREMNVGTAAATVVDDQAKIPECGGDDTHPIEPPNNLQDLLDYSSMALQVERERNNLEDKLKQDYGNETFYNLPFL